MKEDCIFCKLANGVISTNSIYEDDMFKVILDMSPLNQGHALILPKEHYADIFEMDEQVLGKAMILAKKVAAKQMEALKCDGVNIIQNNKEAAGQSVFHFHMHIVPRYKNDGQHLCGTPHDASDSELIETREKLSM